MYGIALLLLLKQYSWTRITLLTYSSPGWAVDEYAAARQSLLSQLRDNKIQIIDEIRVAFAQIPFQSSSVTEFASIFMNSYLKTRSK